MSYSSNEKVWYKKNKKSNPKRIEFNKATITVLINIEKGNMQIKYGPRANTKAKWWRNIYVNDLLEQPLRNETSEDIMHDQESLNEFGNLDEDHIMYEDDPDYSFVWDWSRSPRERNTGET